MAFQNTFVNINQLKFLSLRAQLNLLQIVAWSVM